MRRTAAPRRWRELPMLRPIAFTLLPLLFAAACGAPPAPPDRAAGSDIALPRDTTLVRGLVPRNTTLETMLREHGLAGEVVESVIAAARTAFDPRRLRSLQPFALERRGDGALSFFEYEIDGDSFLRVSPADESEGEMRAEVLPIPKTLQHDSAAGRIDSETTCSRATPTAWRSSASSAMAGRRRTARSRRPSSRTTAACCARSGSRRRAASRATTTSRGDRSAGSSSSRR
jgi:hypothetical protein